ncbi:MAG: TonB-dependent receptor, partial [Myxococcota bacterium]
EALLSSLLDNLGARRIEIDMVEFSGAAFRDVDHRVMSLRLVEFGLSHAAIFSASGEVLRPSEVLYKRPVILQLGRFSPPTKVHFDIQRRALESFCRDPDVDETRVVSILEIAVKELRETPDRGLVDFVDRIDALTAGNHTVLISDYPARYLVAEYLSRYSTSQIALPLGIENFRELMREERYAHLSGGLLQATGRLFGTGVRIYVYPGFDVSSGRRISLESIELPKDVRTLFEFFLEKGYVRALEGLPDEQLRVRTDDVRAMLRSGDSRWESCVEPEIAAAIKAGGLFGYSGAPA